ncbi:MAG TPA: aminotransferase class IV [Dongiaceae bacterium]|jgi:branched-chain amino acid aminotransferase|nr:aminotransferase class IV [Dongiaceae bacterium]
MIWLNGRLVTREQAHIDPADRGLLLADGLFETLRAYRGHVFKLEDHLQRLADGAMELGIPLPLDPPSIAEAVRETLAANQLSASDAALRITLTRGPGQRGLLPPDDPLPTLIISAAAYHAPSNVDGFVAVTAKRARRNEKSITTRLKTLGYLDNVIAQSDAAAAGADEAIMLNNRDAVACGGRSNVFAMMDGALTTPAIEEGALPGITRHAVLALCKGEGIEVREGAMTRAELQTAAEIFVTNSLLEVMPVRRFDEGHFAIGPITKRIAKAYSNLTPR